MHSARTASSEPALAKSRPQHSAGYHAAACSRIWLTTVDGMAIMRGATR